MEKLYRFTDHGKSLVRQQIEALRKAETSFKGSQGTPISSEQMQSLKALAFDPSLREEVSDQCVLDLGLVFPSRYDLGRYLCEILPGRELEGDDNFWTWLSVAYIDQLLAPKKDGTFLLASEYRYIPNNSRLRYYRHLVRMAWKICYQYSEDAKMFLSIEPFKHSDFVEQSQKTDFLSNPNVTKACRLIFFDEKKQKLRKGVSASKYTAPGSMRRLVGVVFKQLDMNFDLHETSANSIITLLPHDFSMLLKMGGHYDDK